jgi:hypothetical protein
MKKEENRLKNKENKQNQKWRKELLEDKINDD